MTLHDPSDSFSPMSTDLKQQIQTNLITARKARNRLETVVLTTLLSEIRNREIEERDELANADVEAVVSRAIKQRRDASTQMRDGGRPELADKEDAEAEILQAYLPPQLSEADVREIVQKAISGGGASGTRTLRRQRGEPYRAGGAGVIGGPLCGPLPRWSKMRDPAA